MDFLSVFYIAKFVTLVASTYVLFYKTQQLSWLIVANILMTTPVSIILRHYEDIALDILLSYTIFMIHTKILFIPWMFIYATWNIHFCSFILDNTAANITANILPIVFTLVSYPATTSYQTELAIWSFARLVCLFFIYSEIRLKIFLSP